MKVKKNKSKFLLILLVLNIISLSGLLIINSSAYSMDISVDKTTVDGGETIELSWTTPNHNTYGFEFVKIYWSINGGSYKYQKSVAGIGFHKEEFTLEESGNYKFKIIAYYKIAQSYGGGGYSYTIWKEYSFDTEYSTNIRVKNRLDGPNDEDVPYNEYIELSWTLEDYHDTTNEYSEVYCSKNGAPFELISSSTKIGFNTLSLVADEAGEWRIYVRNYGDVYSSNGGGMNNALIWSSNMLTFGVKYIFQYDNDPELVCSHDLESMASIYWSASAANTFNVIALGTYLGIGLVITFLLAATAVGVSLTVTFKVLGAWSTGYGFVLTQVIPNEAVESHPDNWETKVWNKVQDKLEDKFIETIIKIGEGISKFPLETIKAFVDNCLQIYGWFVYICARISAGLESEISYTGHSMFMTHVLNIYDHLLDIAEREREFYSTIQNRLTKDDIKTEFDSFRNYIQRKIDSINIWLQVSPIRNSYVVIATMYYLNEMINSLNSLEPQ